MGPWEIMKVLKDIDRDEDRGGYGDRSDRDRELEEAYQCGREDVIEELKERMGSGFGERDGMGGGNGSGDYGRGNYGDDGYGNRRGVKGTGPYSRYRRYRR